MWALFIVICSSLFHTPAAYYDIKPLDKLKLPTSINRGAFVYGGIDLGTAKAAAYDYKNYMLYVLGDTSHLLHVIDISDVNNVQLEFVHEFTKGEGIPQSIDVCDTEVAVGLASSIDVLEGHIQYFKTHVKGSGATGLTIDGYMTVGPHPKHIKFSADCDTLVVANEGSAGKDHTGAFVDPEGSVSIIQNERTGNPSVQLVDFTKYNYGLPDYNQKLRAPSMFIPQGTHSPMTTVSRDMEPENIAVSADGRTAWVSLQENNAVAEIDLNAGTVSVVTPLPQKNWTLIGVDVSDRDGGVHRRPYNGLMSLRQPGKVKTIKVGNKNFLITADEGALKTYTSSLHGFTWSDHNTARALINTIEGADLKASASNDEYLGRLQVSTIDGKNPFTQLYTHLEGFGGRGFSIWDTADLDQPIFDTDGTLEEYMEAWDKSVFNTDWIRTTQTYQSPEQTRDSASDLMGSQVTGLDVKDDNGTMFLLAGTSSSGTLFLYTVDVSSGKPVPAFQTVFRQGVTDLPWTDLYADETIGDLYISDIGIIPSAHSPTDSPLAYVVSQGSGQLSLYSITNIQTIIPGFTNAPIVG